MNLRAPKGYTLLELLVAATVVAILISYGVPRFQKAFEQSRVDLSGAKLESIWTAQRLYKAQNNTFADSISKLGDFLDSSFINSPCISATPCGTTCEFCYRIETAATTTFTAISQRNSCDTTGGCKTTYWDGSLIVDQTGAITGSTFAPRTGTITYQIYPAQF